MTLLTEPVPGIEDELLSSVYRYSSRGGSDLGSLQYVGRYCRFSVPPKIMFQDLEISQFLGVEPEYLPADQSSEAFHKGLRKFGSYPPENYDLQAFSIAVLMMRKHFRGLRGSSLSSLSDIIADMKTDTSPGPSLKHLYKNKGEAVNDYRFDEMYKVFHDSMKKPGGTVSYWGACSKTELREKEKVNQKKTRVFMSGSLFFYLFSMIYCKEFNDMFYTMYLETSSSVGMSKFSGGFHLQISKLKFPERSASTDAHGWDTCMFPDLLMAIAQFRIDCITHADWSDSIAMANIYQQIVFSYVMTGSGDVYRKSQGNPSGSPNTIVDNTLGHYIVKAYAWLRSSYDSLEEDYLEIYYRDFSKYVSMNLFGDDDLMSVSPETPWFTPEEVVRKTAELGFEFTQESNEFTPAHQLSFLSHRFNLVHGYLVPYLPINRLISAAMFSQSDDLFIRAQRLSNLRYEGYYTPGWKPLIDSVIKYFLTRHPDYRYVFDQSLSDREIEHLYLPLESGNDKKFSRVLKNDKLINNDIEF